MKNLINLFILVLPILTSQLVMANESSPYDFYLFYSRPEVQENIFPADKLTYEKIKSWQASTYEEFLDKLNFHAPKFFENEVLIHSSSSLQASSVEAPRILLFGDGLVLSLNEPKDSKERRVELIEFNRQTKRFAPKEIIFADSVSYNDNPTSCRACHGDNENFKPIWNPYDFWPRAFGSRIGRIGTNTELKSYLSYFQDNNQGVRRYLQKDTTEQGATIYHQSIEAFTGYMNTLNSVTMAKKISESDLGNFKYALQWTVNFCGAQSDEEFLSLFPEDVIKKMPHSYEDIYEDTVKSRSFFKDYLDEVYLSVFNDTGSLAFIDHNRLIDEQDTVAKIRFILENNGVSLRSLIMSHGANDYFFSTPNNFIADLKDTLDYELSRLSTSYTNESGDYVFIPVDTGRCDKLKELSIQNLKTSDVQPVKAIKIRFQKSGTDLSPVAQCMKCHTFKYRNDKTKGPFIPFDDSLKMQELLRNTDLSDEITYRLTTEDEIDMMPPTGHLPKEDVAAVLEYIETLKK